MQRLLVFLFVLAHAAAASGAPRLGLQSYTCRQMSFEDVVRFAASAGITDVQFFKRHLHPDDPDEVNREKREFMRKHRVTAYSGYFDAGLDQAQNRKVFELARLFGMKFVVIEPKELAAWDQLEVLVREFNIGAAVHNHGTGTVYGDPAIVRQVLAGRDPRIGVCLDIAWVSVAGFDAAAIFRSYGDRVFDLHLKDKVVVAKEGNVAVVDTLIGHGQVNLGGVVAAIKETGWSGVMALETDSREFAAAPETFVRSGQAFFDQHFGPIPPPPAGTEPSSNAERSRALTDEEGPILRAALRELERKVAALGPSEVMPDVDLYRKGIAWALRYQSVFTAADREQLKRALERGNERADAALLGRTPWRAAQGRLLRAYVSTIDGSTQPFGLIIPRNYDGVRPIRLDVVLHGSSRPVGMSELRFGARFDSVDVLKREIPDDDSIELHPLGRVENGFRWAGEADIFEAIEAVCRDYRIDRDRMVLRGFSMGASGTWHIGLKHPDRFVAIGPYCGYVDTRRFSQMLSPMPRVRVDHLPWHQDRVLPLLDAIGYAANAGIVPTIAAMGEKDPGFLNHSFMAEAMTQEGLQMVNLVSPGTAHVIDPVTQREQLRLIKAFADRGLDRAPRHLRFVTWTLKYSRAHWLEVLGLDEHYARTEVEAWAGPDGSVDIRALENVSRFSISAPMLQSASARLRIAGQPVALSGFAPSPSPRSRVFARENGHWNVLGERGTVALPGKRPGLQGPIDDAFMTAFLCVRGTGRPWNEAVDAWSRACLDRFGYEWARYLGGDLPMKTDVEVTAEDLRTKNLILFGDPGSNRWIRDVLSGLPLGWSPTALTLGGATYPAESHVPRLICPNPLPGAENRYVVINSGHTFGERDFTAPNYMLFPRLGDWAVSKVATDANVGPATAHVPMEEPVRAGFFGEDWKTPWTQPAVPTASPTGSRATRLPGAVSSVSYP